MDTLGAPATLLGRLMLAAIFIQSGYGKIGEYAGTQAYMEKFGVERFHEARVRNRRR